MARRPPRDPTPSLWDPLPDDPAKRQAQISRAYKAYMASQQPARDAEVHRIQTENRTITTIIIAVLVAATLLWWNTTGKTDTRNDEPFTGLCVEPTPQGGC